MKVFVGGLPWGVDNDRLKEVFSEHGPLIEAIVVYDKETDKSRGFGFVTFSDQADAEKLLAQGSLEVDGRTVRIDRANEKRQSRGRAGGGGHDHGGQEPRFEERRSGRGRERRGRDRY